MPESSVARGPQAAAANARAKMKPETKALAVVVIPARDYITGLIPGRSRSCYNLRVGNTPPLFYRCAKALLYVGSKLVFRITHEGVENIPREGGLFIASNHASHLDPPLVGIGVPRQVTYVAKQELAGSRFLKWFMRKVDTILIDRSRGRGALDQTIERLEKGQAVIFFPEGTRTRTGRLNRGRRGAAVIVLKSGATVVPTCIVGSHECFPPGAKLPRPGKVTVRFGPPLTFKKVDREEIPPELLDSTLRQIMDAIEDLLPERMRPKAEEKRDWYTREDAANETK